MKKYIAPSVEILAINAESMMALSFQLNDAKGGMELSNEAEDLGLGWTDED